MYAYVCEAQAENRPWTEAEYRALMNDQVPSPRALIWLAHSTAPMAYIGLDVHPMYITPPGYRGDLMTNDPPAACGSYIAAHSVVVIAHWLPDSLLHVWENQLFDQGARRGLSRIWPTSDEPIAWPTTEIPEDRLFRQATFTRYLADIASLPTEGLTETEYRALLGEYEAGADPRELRARHEGS